MCGICGVVGILEGSDYDRVSVAKNALRHRGPDGNGQWSYTDAKTGFGAVVAHTRLSIIDLREISGQPMIDDETGVCIVFNGEIYNFTELRAQLQSEGIDFVTKGDTEVILRGFIAWGDTIVSRMQGMFSFVIYDTRINRAIFGRDGYGIKPLYTAIIRDGKAIAFASEVRALLQSGYAKPHTDNERLRQYLWNGFMPSPQTLLTGVDNFPKGCVGSFDSNQMLFKTNHFWKNSAKLPSQQRRVSAENAFQQSVEKHLIADVPMGVFLSGGVDSSAVAAMASNASDSIRTLSIGFNEESADETKFAESVSKHIQSEHQTITITGSEMLHDLNDSIAGLDQPSFDGINNWFVSRAAVQSGLKVAIAGTGGDELLGGYTSFRRIPKLMRLSAAMGFATHGAEFKSLARTLGTYTSRAKVASIPSTRGCPVKLYQLQYALFSDYVIDKLISNTSDTDVSWGLSPERFTELQNQTRHLPPLRAISLLESELFLSDRLLRDTDSVSMNHSLEVRVPLVDTTLLDQISMLTDDERYLPIGKKKLLREIAENATSKGFFDRPKRGFEFPFDEWIRGPLHDEIRQLFYNSDVCISIGLNPAVVQEIWRIFIARPSSIYWTRIWSLYVLLKWCKDNHITSIN